MQFRQHTEHSLSRRAEHWLSQRWSPVEVEGLRWRLRRAFGQAPRADTMFDLQSARTALQGAQGRFVTFPWIDSHSGALIRLFDPESQLTAAIPLFRRPEELRQRQRINVFCIEQALAYQNMLRALLAPVRTQIAGVLMTLDWAPAMRQVAYVCRELGIRSVLVPHEAVFADRQRYYVDRLTGADVPACDSTLCWGELQKSIFEERGYPPERLLVVGSCKLDEARRYRAAMSRESFAACYGLSAEQPIVLFAAQPLDSQYSADVAREAQARAIADLLALCDQSGSQLLVRMPPSGHHILPEELTSRLNLAPNARIDAAPHRTGPLEALQHVSSVCSINSTMLLEAVIVGRAALSMRYLSFDELWSQAGIPAARDRAELAQHAQLLFSGGGPASRDGLGWAARAFSAGNFDGGSSERIRNALQAQRGTGRPVVRDVCEERTRRQRLAGDLTALLMDPSMNAEDVRLALGVRRVLPARTMRSGQLADLLVTSDRPAVLGRARRWAMTLGRPLLIQPHGSSFDRARFAR